LRPFERSFAAEETGAWVSIMSIGWNQILAVVANGPRENGSEDLQ